MDERWEGKGRGGVGLTVQIPPGGEIWRSCTVHYIAEVAMAVKCVSYYRSVARQQPCMWLITLTEFGGFETFHEIAVLPRDCCRSRIRL